MRNLVWEISYLQRNLKPMNQLGQELTSINGTSLKLKDEDVSKLSLALKQNSVFEGGIYLAENLLTDLSVLYLTEALQASGSKILALDLSFNFLKDKAGVYIGNLLASGYQLQQLYLKGCNVGVLGVQRIFENVDCLQVVDIGLVGSESLLVMGKYIQRSSQVKQVCFQQAETWNTQREFIDLIKDNYSVLSYQVDASELVDFVDEVNSVADRNRMVDGMHLDERNQEMITDPKNFAQEIQMLIENDFQNLPVRVYLENAIGTLLNDGIYALMKYRFKENNSKKNTAVNNIKWLVRYILDNSRN